MMSGGYSGTILEHFPYPDRRKYEVAHLKRMKMKKNLILCSLLTGFLMAGLLACNKDESQPNGDDKTTLLVSGSWKLTAATINGADAMSLLQDCEKDNITMFANSGNGTVAEAALKCDPGDPDVAAFTWQWKNNETILSVSSPLITYGTNDMTLDKLTSSQLIISMAYTPPVGPSKQIVLTFQH